jgi:hypothetical protein
VCPVRSFHAIDGVVTPAAMTWKGPPSKLRATS